jgi:hypothetical protein
MNNFVYNQPLQCIFYDSMVLFLMHEKAINSYPFSCQGTNMFTYLKFGLPRVLPPGREETSSDFNSSDEEVAARTSRARTRLRPSRSEEYLDRPMDGQDNR